MVMDNNVQLRVGKVAARRAVAVKRGVFLHEATRDVNKKNSYQIVINLLRNRIVRQ
jgi:hypothetical protein